MKKSYIVFVDGQHEYTIKSKLKKNGDTKHTLYRSNSADWTERVRGEKCLTIIDSDLEMEIKGVDGIQPYHTIHELKILLDFITREYSDGNIEIVEKHVIYKNKV